eukprot:9568226-Alexandrium_andersonii.AAC.1
MHYRFRRSELDLCGPRHDLKRGPRGSRGVRPAPFCAQRREATLATEQRINHIYAELNSGMNETERRR